MKRHWQKAFLAILAETGKVTTAAEAAGIERSTAYDAFHSNKEFAAAWEQALETAADVMVDEARRRAYEGVEEPVFHQGKQVALVRKYSDVLLMFLIKGYQPQRFRESRATIPPAQLNRLIEIELDRIAKQKEADANEAVN